jgi:hypothetical protein
MSSIILSALFSVTFPVTLSVTFSLLVYCLFQSVSHILSSYAIRLIFLLPLCFKLQHQICVNPALIDIDDMGDGKEKDVHWI